MEGRVAAAPSLMAAAAGLLWAAATLGWWALAVAPLPADPPAWLAATRTACFGPMPSGWPGSEGWIMLALAPASLLAGLAVVWGRDLGPSLRRVGRSGPGRALLAAALVATLVEGSWVAGKLRTARAVVTAGPGAPEAGPLPATYPRRDVPAPDFALGDQHGRPISLAAFRGRPVVLAFTFGHCQTLCPVLVATVVRAVPGAADARGLLVTLDPWRDTPSALEGVARRWALPPGVHFLSSRSPDEVLAVVRAYGVPFERSPTTGDIVHPGLVYLIDARGRLAYTFTNPSPEWIREGLRRLGEPDGRTG
jgi:protein SCO1/2